MIMMFLLTKNRGIDDIRDAIAIDVCPVYVASDGHLQISDPMAGGRVDDRVVGFTRR